jgi:ATP-dependent helicase/nuclease subunit B
VVAPAPGVERLAFPPEEISRAAARLILARHFPRAGALPVATLESVNVVFPNLRVAQTFPRCLGDEAALDTLPLPRLTTLADWTRTTSLPGRSLSNAQRELRLYEALRKNGWFQDHNLWRIARELRELADELTAHRIPLVDNAREFAQRLATAYRTRLGTSLQFEARVAFEMWRALADTDEGRDGVARYHMQLSRIASAAAGPLYVVEPGRLSPVESEFLEVYAQRAPVCLMTADLHSPLSTPRGRVLANALLNSDEGSLRERAGQWSAHVDPLHASLRLFPARSLEEEAGAVEQRVRQWIMEGRQSIALVAQDRIVARRVRALLERAKVLVEDETGWTLSTTSAASVLMRVLDCVTDNFHHHDLFDLLKSPFVFADLVPAERKPLGQTLERFARDRHIASGLDAYADCPAVSVKAAVDRLQVLARMLSGRPASIATWIDRVLKALDALGAREALQRDAVGSQLLDLLARLAAHVREEAAPVSLGEWRQWLDGWLEIETFKDHSATSPVCLTSLSATRLREFDAVVILGCDDSHLPAERSGTVMLGDAARGELGLPRSVEHRAQQKQDLLGLVARSGAVFITWQSRRHGEDNAPSGWIDLVESFHACAWPDGPGLRDDGVALRLAHRRILPEPTLVLARPVSAPAPAFQCTPPKISVSAYGSLVVCPYQFYGRHLLGLGELTELRELVEKRDYGEFIHAILHQFHRAHPVVQDIGEADAVATLEHFSTQVFEPALRHDPMARAWWFRWKNQIPKYLQWQREREAAGWRFEDGEVAREVAVEGIDSLTLKGRLDRIDRQDAARSVIDYKTADKSLLQEQLRDPGENVQLACYALLAENVVDARFLSLNKDAPVEVPLEDDLRELADACEARLADVFQRLRQGAGLPANGDDKSCASCEMKGLCRKDHWPAVQAPRHGPDVVAEARRRVTP